MLLFPQRTSLLQQTPALIPVYHLLADGGLSPAPNPPRDVGRKQTLNSNATRQSSRQDCNSFSCPPPTLAPCFPSVEIRLRFLLIWHLCFRRSVQAAWDNRWNRLNAHTADDEMLYNSVKGQTAVISLSAAPPSAFISQHDSAANWSNKLLVRFLLKLNHERVQFLYKVSPLMASAKTRKHFSPLDSFAGALYIFSVYVFFL